LDAAALGRTSGTRSSGLDPHKCFTEVYEDGDVKNSIRVQVQVLDTVVFEEALEEIARREC
jgi:hypothetical protein